MAKLCWYSLGLIPIFISISLCYPHHRPQEDLWMTSELGKDPIRCKLCLAAMKKVYDYATRNRTEQSIQTLVAKACRILHIDDEVVCNGAISEYGEMFLYVVDNLLFSPKRICGALLDGCGGPKPDIRPNGYWRVPMLNTTKPPRQKPVLPSPDKPKLRVLHLADMHFDKNYVEGSESDCNEPLCCRNTNATIIRKPAGKWGSQASCDVPRRTLENMLQHVATRNDYDYVIWTGDAPPHDIWKQNKESQLEVLDTLFELLHKYFPNKLLISTVGNHESAPANNYPPHSAEIPKEYSTAWLYQLFSDQWTKFGIGQDPQIRDSINERASYVTKPYPGLRVISLNTMYCLQGNYWLYLNEYDPDGELNWLIRQLQDAEDVGDKVHIIGHIPPGDSVSCLKEWSANFYDIVNRYENTVTGLFFGHTHQDSFSIIYENGTLNDPIHVVYVAPSATTYPKYWPSFRIYTIDGNYNGSSYRVLDHETYMLNLDKANAEDNPIWELEYTAKEAYKMDSLLPAAWNELITRFQKDDPLFQSYYGHYYHGPRKSPCLHECKQKMLCEMRSGRTHDSSFCKDL